MYSYARHSDMVRNELLNNFSRRNPCYDGEPTEFDIKEPYDVDEPKVKFVHYEEKEE